MNKEHVCKAIQLPLFAIRKGSTPQRLVRPLPSISYDQTIVLPQKLRDSYKCRRSFACSKYYIFLPAFEYSIYCTAKYSSIALRSRTMSHSQFYVVDSQKVQYNSDRDALISTYDYQTSHVDRCPDGRLRVTPITKTLTFRTSCRVPRVGCMLVGWGGNNGSTVTATVLANKLKVKWRTKDGIKVNCAVSVIVVYEFN